MDKLAIYIFPGLLKTLANIENCYHFCSVNVNNTYINKNTQFFKLRIFHSKFNTFHPRISKLKQSKNFQSSKNFFNPNDISLYTFAKSRSETQFYYLIRPDQIAFVLTYLLDNVVVPIFISPLKLT